MRTAVPVTQMYKTRKLRVPADSTIYRLRNLGERRLIGVRRDATYSDATIESFLDFIGSVSTAPAACRLTT